MKSDPHFKRILRSSWIILLGGLGSVLVAGALLCGLGFNVQALELLVEGAVALCVGVLCVRLGRSVLRISSTPREVRWAERERLRAEAGYDVRAARKYAKALRDQLKGFQFMRERFSLSAGVEALEVQVKAEGAKVEARIRMMQ